MNLIPRFRNLIHISSRAYVHEVKVLDKPPYLDSLRPKVGFFKLINLSIMGYDYVILEKYQSYLHKTMRKMDFKIVQTWPTPHRECRYDILQPESSGIVCSDKIWIYERNIQMKDALVTQLPILIDLINMTLPPGIWFTLDRHGKEAEDRRYFRDSTLEKLKVELEELYATPIIGAEDKATK